MELKKRLLNGTEPQLGAFLGLPSPSLTEMLGLAGFDFVILDAEHGAFDLAQLEECLRAATSVGVSCVVRVGGLNSHAVQTVLDLGAEGIQVPQVESAEGARKAVEFSHYPPAGLRGYGSTTRAAGYGFQARNRVIADAVQNTVVCVQIESRAGVENLQAIADTPGVDVVFIGTSDLSLSYGLDSPNDPKVNALVDSLVPAIVKAGKVPGIFPVTGRGGITSCIWGSDTSRLRLEFWSKKRFNKTQNFAGLKTRSFGKARSGGIGLRSEARCFSRGAGTHIEKIKTRGMKMEQDLNQFIQHLEKRRPGSLVRISKEVDPVFEIPAIVTSMENRKKHAVLIFERVRNLHGNISKLPVVVNLFWRAGTAGGCNRFHRPKPCLRVHCEGSADTSRTREQ